MNHWLESYIPLVAYNYLTLVFLEMNILSYKTDDYHQLYFELLVDGEPLGNIIGSQNTYFPYWIVEDNLPYFPPNSPEHREENTFIVSVCDGCGEYGCGNTHCKIIRKDNEIVFCDFHGELSANAEAKEFHFAIENYATVVNQIVTQAKEEQLKYQNNRQNQ